MANNKLKVVVIGTGNVAGVAIRCLKGRDDMELVGVWGHKETAPQHIGMDSGLLDLDEPNGIIITGDEEEIFALKPDCAVMAINIRDPMAASAVNGAWYKKFLSRGINVVSPSVPDLIWPRGAFNQPFVEEIRQAALEGGASIFINGQEPGYAEHQAMLLATCSNTINKLTIREMYNYSTAPLRAEMAPSYGFDEPPEYQCMLQDPNTQIFIWGLTIRNIANNLGYEIEGFKTSFEKRVTDKPIPVGWGTIEPGKVGAVWVRTAGIVNGREAIVIEHVNRMAPDIAMDWPYTDRVGQISVRIEGDPNLQVDMNVSLPEQPEELSYEGYVLTAMRIVNAIPHVCAGKPGILTIHDFPMALPGSAFRSTATHIDHKICKAK